MADDLINNRIKRFKADLLQLDPITMVRRHLIFGDSYILDVDKHFELKTEISAQFRIHPSEVLLVGSAQLGFSIVPKKRYRPFNDSSDIDIAIVSPFLFDLFWEQAFDYWNSGRYWPEQDAFKDYLFRGWIRPDKLPPSHKFTLGKDWWEFFQYITAKGKYGPFPLRAGLYKSWTYFEKYQHVCIEQCKQEL